jgi:16S rRNA (guanine(966)-N(2))-methyltransferase RsmD
VRIIAGEFKRRKLLSCRGLNTRPITSRVKTALFSILGDAVPAAVVADLFAGTGSIGLEALSRGAGLCYFAERDRASLDVLRRNIQALSVSDRSRVWAGDVLRTLRRRLGQVQERIDLAFVDPPYRLVAGWRWEQATEALFGPLGRHLAAGGTVVLRCQRNIEVPQTLGPLRVRDRRDYGKMSLVFLSPLPAGDGERDRPPAPEASGLA